MTTTQMLDALAPYTPEEKRCGYKKKRKIDLRYRLLLEIEKMQRDGLRNDDILINLSPNLVTMVNGMKIN